MMPKHAIPAGDDPELIFKRMIGTTKDVITASTQSHVGFLQLKVICLRDCACKRLLGRASASLIINNPVDLSVPLLDDHMKTCNHPIR